MKGELINNIRYADDSAIIASSLEVLQSLLLNQTPIEYVEKYTHLGTIVYSTWYMTIEIISRIEKARLTFVRMKNIFTGRNISLPVKIRLTKCYIFTVLLYGVEAWTMTEQLMKKISAFEMWIYRRVLPISWKDHITKEDVLKRIGRQQEITFMIKKRKL